MTIGMALFNTITKTSSIERRQRELGMQQIRDKEATLSSHGIGSTPKKLVLARNVKALEADARHYRLVKLELCNLLANTRICIVTLV